MHTRKPLIAAAVLSLVITGPAVVSALSPSAGIHDQGDQEKKGKDRNRQNNGNRNNGHGRNGGEDLTRMRFAGLDTNHDGRITRDEWPGNDNSFNQHDWNGDGVLSGLEVTPGAQNPNAGDELAGFLERFDQLDLNDDNRLSLTEWPGRRDTFDRLDTNDDGFLTREELQAGLGTGNNRLGRAFRALDVNHDGRVSRAEWRGDLAEFDRLDTNDDGFLSFDEFSRR